MDFREKIKLELKNAGIDISLNNTVDDLFIKKFIELNEPLNESINEFPDKLSFKNFEDLDKEDQDRFAGNFFVKLSDGEKAKGDIRIYFDSPTDSFVGEGTEFSTESGLNFYATQDYNMDTEEMAEYSEGMYYYQTVEVEAEAPGVDYNVSPERIDRCSNPVIMSRAIKISNPYQFTDGKNVESPAETYERVKESISVRNLANDPSIKSVIRNQFENAVIDLFNVRSGHELMHREIEVINDQEYRVGNKHDIWVETTDLIEHTVDITKNAEATVNFGFSIGDLGQEIYEVGHEYVARDINDEPIDKVVIECLEVSALSSEGEVTEEIEGVKFIQDNRVENSTRQKSYLDFSDSTYSGTVTNVRVKFLASESLTSIQKFVNAPENRMPVGDPLVRHFEIIPLYGIIYYKGDVEEIELQEALDNFIKHYHYNEDTAQREFIYKGEPIRRIIEISDFVSKLYEEGVDKVKMPVNLSMDLPYMEVEPFSIVSDYDTELDLGYQNILYNSEVITDGVSVFERNTDYSMDYENGKITILSTGNMLDATAYNVEFNARNITAIGETANYTDIEDQHKILPYQMLLPKVSVSIED